MTKLIFLLLFQLPLVSVAQFASIEQYSAALGKIKADSKLKKVYGTKNVWVSNEIISWDNVATLDGPLDLDEKQDLLDIDISKKVLDKRLQQLNGKKSNAIVNFTPLVDGHLGALIWIDYVGDHVDTIGPHYHFIFKFQGPDIVKEWKQIVHVN